MSAVPIDELPPAELPPEPWLDVPLTWVGTALDRVAMSGLRLALSAALALDPRKLDEVLCSGAPYVTDELAADPRRFFAFLDEPPARVVERVAGRRRMAGGAIVLREFVTRYVPYHATGAWRACAENERVRVEHWMHRSGRSRATVLTLHGFGMGQGWVDAHVLMAMHWFTLGLDVALLTLPFHGPRAPRTSRYSGELFGSWDVGCLNESVRQAVHDVHLVTRWLVRRTGTRVGLLGWSLGGYIAALCAGLMPELAFVVSMLSPVCLGALPSRLLRLEDLKASDPSSFSLERLRRAYRVHCPLTYPLALPREHALIVGGRGDLIVPPEHVHRLWLHWGKPAIHWFSGSHSVPFRRGHIAERIGAHFRALGLAGSGTAVKPVALRRSA